MQRLEDALGRLADQDERIEVDTLIERLEADLAGRPVVTLVPVSESRSVRRWRGPLVAVGALVAALLVAVPLLVFRGVPDEEAADATTSVPPTAATPPTTEYATTTSPPPTSMAPPVVATTEVTTTAAPTMPEPPVAPIVWTQVDLPGAPGDGDVLALIQTADGFVAFGKEPNPDSVDFDAGDGNVVWASTDGWDWVLEVSDGVWFPDGEGTLRAVAWGKRVIPASLADTFDSEDVRVSDIALWGERFVAVGARVWMSMDGVVWEEHPAPALPDRFHTVIATESGLIAAGSVRGGTGPNQSIAAVWISPDGITWTPAVVETGGTIEMGSGIYTLAATGNGYVAAGYATTGWESYDTGHAMLEYEQQQAAMWWSADGSTWELVYVEEGRHSSTVNDVATDGTLVVAVGDETEYTYAGALWWSPDGGLTWHRDLDLQLGFADPQTSNGADATFATLLNADGRWLISGRFGESAIWVGTLR